MTDEAPRRCTGCKFCYIEDTGYSNYTVTETTIYCLLHLNPGLPTEDSGWRYDAASKDHRINKYAEKCDRFAQGVPQEMDVDHWNEPDIKKALSADAELKAAWTAFNEKAR